MMKHSYFKTHWTPDEALAVLQFLDELRELIWQSYGYEILEQCHPEHTPPHADQGELPFDDPIPF